MKQYGLIGKTLKHSFSEKYFGEKFEKEAIKNTKYSLYELEEINAFRKLISENTVAGLNVTIPYKESIIPFLDDIDETAKSIGAVNTIDFKHGKLTGYNTDVIGFGKALKRLIGRKTVRDALVLGSGGASKAIQYFLREKGINFSVVSRSNGDLTYDQLDAETMRSHRLIINCTPVGTFPDVNKAPVIPNEYLHSKHLLFDLVYNPEKTLFLTHGESVGASIMNGYEMLVEQAEASWEIWNTY